MNLDLWSSAFPSGDVIPGRSLSGDESASPWRWRENADPNDAHLLNRERNIIPNDLCLARNFMRTQQTWMEHKYRR